MTVPSFVAEFAAAAVRQAATQIGTPAAAALSAEAGSLVHDAPALAARIGQAVGEMTDTVLLEGLAESGLTLPAVPLTTASRRTQAANQAALVDLVRGVATAQLARRTADAGYESRTAALAARDRVGALLDARAPQADDASFRALRALRGAVMAHIAREVETLPEVTTATPASVRPSLALSYAIYGDVSHAAGIAARNQVARPGFVPAEPIEILT